MPFVNAARGDWAPKRVAYSADLGITPVDPEVAAVTRSAAERLSREGVIVEHAHPDLSGAHECFQVLRAHSFVTSLGGFYETHRDKLKPDVIWNIEAGLKLSASDIVKAHRHRAHLARTMDAFLQDYDLLLTPATISAAFPIEQIYLAECNGTKFENYIRWLAIAYATTLCGTPAISLPCGFTEEGLPVGLQIVAPTNDDAKTIAGAAFIERVIAVTPTTPIDPR